MRIDNVLPVTVPARPRERERDGRRTDETRFSPRHVILDLSPTAMKQLGLRATARSEPPILYVYDDTGAFAYRAPMAAGQAWQPVAQSTPLETGIADAEDVTDEPTFPEPPSIVAFDGMLGARMYPAR